jgi:hypothetical protein
MPFGQEGTTRHVEYRDVFDLIIRDTLSPLGLECTRADILPSWGGSIPEAISTELRNADLVVADLTERNPNVFYEMGYRQALHRPIITISQGDLAELPFNVHHLRTIGYDPRNLRSVAECKRQLGDAAKLAHRRGKQDPLSEPEPSAEPPGRTIEIGLHNIYGEIVQIRPEFSRLSEVVGGLASRCAFVSEQPGFARLMERIDNLVSTSQTILQTTELGVVGAYSNRKDAIESAFYRVMREEDEGIDIVGSTIFGLRGNRDATFEKMMELLRTKHANSRFHLRILMTHWEFIAFRQDQEKTEKNVARYVISGELRDAVDVIKANGLEGCLKFYRGSPTCFTIVARGQRQMLLNPYPYQAEAYNSWCIIARDTPGGIYSRFVQAHVEGPWQNTNLTVPYTDQVYSDLLSKHTQDIDVAKQLTLAQLGEIKR